MSGSTTSAPYTRTYLSPRQEDLTPETIKKVLDDMSAGRKPKPGPQSGRRTVEPKGQAITLVGKVCLPPRPRWLCDAC